VRAGGGAHPGGAEHVLDAEGNAGERSALPARQRRIGTHRHLAGPLRRFQNEGVERACAAYGIEMRVGEFHRRELALAQPCQQFREGERSKLAHSPGVSSQEKPRRAGLLPFPP
jgi:hypothetical protein